MCIRAYADSEGLDQPAHTHSLIRTFPVRETDTEYKNGELWPEWYFAQSIIRVIALHPVHVRRHLSALRGSHNVRLLKCKTQIGLVSKRKNMKKKKKKKKNVSAN